MNQNINFFGKTNFRNSEVKFGIKTDDRRRHMYIIGKTGMGKSVLQENMIIQDIHAGHGVCVIDPHGDLVEKVIDFIPANRINDVIYFNPADLDFPIAFNVLEIVDESERHLVVSGLIGVFKKIWADSWGPRLEYVLHHAISALLEYPGSTLLGIMRMLVDKNFRNKVVDKLSDPVVKAFWVEEYAKYPDKFQSEAIAPIQNKVGRFLSSSLIRNVLGQVKSSFTMRDVMDNQKILLLNLAKGRVGEDNSALLGAMMITKIQLAAMSRVNIPETERKDFFLYVDEFQNFATESFANILSEARKYRLDLTIAHQYIEQVDEKVQAAIFGNVGTIVSFRVGAVDAEYLEKEFFPQFTQENLVNLPKYQIYLKLMIDGVASEAFSATTLPPIDIKPSDKEVRDKVIRVSRERYASPREEIEEKIMRWSENKDEKKEEKKEEHIEKKFEAKNYSEKRPIRDEHASSKKRSDRPEKSSKTNHQEKPTRDKPGSSKGNNIKRKINCSFCGSEAEINFDPDPTKAVYCKNCLDLAKAGKIPPPSSIKIVPNYDREDKKEEFVSLAEALKAKPEILRQDQSDEEQNIIQPGEIVKF